MGDLVLTQINSPIASITLDRASRHNSLVPALLDEMLYSLKTLESNMDVRVVILQANGRTFSTGGDLAGFMDHIDTIEDYSSKLVGQLNEVMLKMISMPMPIIAAVHGLVTGGALGLLLASDIVLMASEASITPYYSVVGFSPDGGWTAMLPQIIGSKRTSEIILLNQTITAEQALLWGLASRIVHANGIRDEAERIAREIAKDQTGSISKSKRLIHNNDGDLETRLDSERVRFVEQISKPETQQSLAAFLEQMKMRSP